jgi:hypothetical protein
MNPRIQELARQAGWYITDDDEHSTLFGKFVERFAELIVRDCALTAGLMEHQGRSGIGAQILDNFGVEE